MSVERAAGCERVASSAEPRYRPLSRRLARSTLMPGQLLIVRSGTVSRRRRWAAERSAPLRAMPSSAGLLTAR
jgi:hypothetical protein